MRHSERISLLPRRLLRLRSPSWPWRAVLLVTCAALGCGGTDVAQQHPTALPRAQLPTDARPLGYRLLLDIDPRQSTFSGRVEIDLEMALALDGFWIHARDIAARAVVLHQDDAIGGRLRQLSADGIARIELERTARPGPAVLVIDYSAPFSLGAEGLYRVHLGDDWYVFSQFEPLDARRAFPSFDEPGHKVPFEITLRGRDEDILVASTPEISRKSISEGRVEVRFARTPKLPTYLLAFAAGPLDVVEGGRVGEVPIRGLAARGRGAGLARALADTPGLVKRLQDYFQIAYPFEKLDIVAVPGQIGAMENVGLITYSEDLILLADGAPLSQQRTYANVHLHELAHQWFGNLVTMRWWDDLWLNEALADWITNRLGEAWHPEFALAESVAADVSAAMDADSFASARRIREPIEDFNDVVNAFDDITYTKGAAVLAMAERYAGEAAFRQGIRSYLQQFAGGSADADDFLRSIAEAAKDAELPAIVRSFVSQPGVPELRVDVDCAPGSASAPALVLTQARYLPLGSRAMGEERWQLPVCVRVADAPPICRLMTEPVMRLPLPLPDKCPAWVMPNSGAAGYYRFVLADADLSALMAAMGRTLSAAERVAVADSLEAGVRAGRISIASLLDQAAPLAATGERHLVTAPVRLWSQMQDAALEGAALERSRSRMRDVYRPVLAELRASGAGADPLLLREVVRILALTAQDPDVRADLAARADAFLGPSEVTEAAELPRDWLGIAFTVAAEDGGPERIARLAAVLERTDDALTRAALIRGIGAARDPTLARSLLEGTSMRGAERYLLVAALMHRDRIGINADWFLAHVPSALDQYAPFGHGDLIRPFGTYCDRAGGQAIATRLRPLVGKLEGGPRALEQTLESIELCAALLDHQGDDMRRYFSGD